MATYGISLYGRDPYGPGFAGALAPGTGSVEPFVAEALDYSTIRLTWKSPTTTPVWTALRVLRSWTGFAVNPSDGELLLDTARPTNHLIDIKVRPGAWHYYSIFIQISGVWHDVGRASVIMPRDHAYATRLFELLPRHHRFLPSDQQDVSPVDNETLKRFLSVLGWGLDGVKTQYDALQYRNDPLRNSLPELVTLTKQLGIVYEPAAPTTLFRQRVRNAALLDRSKGTLEQIRSLISLTTGYDVILKQGPNLMLNEDSASFYHPQYPVWNPAVNYATDERARYNSYTYAAKVGGAYGPAQQPSGLTADNTWWTYMDSHEDATLTDANGANAGWASESYTTGVTPTPSSSLIAIGAQSFLDPTVNSANLLFVRNKTAGAYDAGARSITRRLGESNLDPSQVFTLGVPVPMVFPFSATTQYEVDNLVNYNGLTYQCIFRSLGALPSGTAADNVSWKCVGGDERPTLAVSMHLGAGSGAAVPTYPIVELYDESGTLIALVDTETNPANPTFDSFGQNPGAITGRTSESGGKAWTVQSGNWVTSPQMGGVAWTSSTGQAVVTGAADGQVSATFVAKALGAMKQAVVFRGTDSTHYLRATRTELFTVNAGVVTSLGVYATPFADGDRITVSFTGTAVVIKRNGVTVLTVASSFNQTGTLHGLAVN